MLQFSVYGRVVNGFDDAEKHLKRLQDSLPPAGSVRCLKVTEKQFTKMLILVGDTSLQEKVVTQSQMLLF